jgi:hypothetical protein
MTLRPTLFTAEIAERILERLASGCSLNAVCRDDGMPPPSTVLDWVRQDRDGFAARYHDAREIGNPMLRSYVTVYTDAIAERMLCELRRGRALRDVCQDDGMPSVRTVTRWVENDREGFGARYLEARTEGRARMAHYTLYTPELAELILDELCIGRTLADVCSDPGMPSIRTVHHWVLYDREGFRARYHEAREIGCHTRSDQMLDIADDCRNDRTLRRNKDGSCEFVVNLAAFKRAGQRIGARQWLASRMLPAASGHRRLDTASQYEADLAEMMQLLDGRTRGLPCDDRPLHENEIK